MEIPKHVLNWVMEQKNIKKFAFSAFTGKSQKMLKCIIVIVLLIVTHETFSTKMKRNFKMM